MLIGVIVGLKPSRGSVMVRVLPFLVPEVKFFVVPSSYLMLTPAFGDFEWLSSSLSVTEILFPGVAVAGPETVAPETLFT